MFNVIPNTQPFRFSIFCNAFLQCQIMRSLPILVCMILVQCGFTFLGLLFKKPLSKQGFIWKLFLIVLHRHVVLLQVRVGYVAQLCSTYLAIDKCMRFVIFILFFLFINKPLLMTILYKSDMCRHTLLILALFSTIFAFFHIISPRSYIIYTEIQ